MIVRLDEVQGAVREVAEEGNRSALVVRKGTMVQVVRVEDVVSEVHVASREIATV